MEQLAAGRYTLRISAPSHERQQQAIELAHGQTLQLPAFVLAPAATLRVRFLRPDGTAWRGRPPVPWLQDERGQWLLASRTGDVAYAVDGDEVVVTVQSPGRYRLGGPQGDDLLIEPRDVQLERGVTSRIEVPVAVGRRRALLFARPPKSSANEVVRAEVRNSAGELVLRTDCARSPSSSGFVARHVFAPGRYAVSATSESGARYQGSFTVDLDPSQPRTIEVPLVQ